MNRRRGILWLVAGLVLALVAAGLSYFAIQQLASQQPDPAAEKSTQTVVVARQLINERAVIRLDDVKTEDVPIEQVPSGAIFKTEDAVGRLSTRSISGDQVILAQYLMDSFPSSGDVEPTDVTTETVNLSQALGEDLVAYALPASSRLSMEGILLPGDRVDLLFSTDVVGQQEGTGGKVAIYAIQDLKILQVIYQAPPAQEKKPEGQPGEAAEPEPTQAELVPKTLILAMQPQDAVVLKYALDIQAPIDLALRAADNRRIFEVDAATINTIAERYDFIAPRPIR